MTMYGMIKRYVALLVLVMFALAGCGGEEPSTEKVTVKRAFKKPAVKKVQPAQEEESFEEEKIDITKLKRNPFLSYLAKVKVSTEKRIKTPLECCEVGVFRLVAVVTGIKKPRAVVQAPDGKRYIIRKGDRIGIKEGRVVAITMDSVIIKEKIRDAEGNVIATETVRLTLPEKK